MPGSHGGGLSEEARGHDPWNDFLFFYSIVNPRVPFVFIIVLVLSEPVGLDAEA